MVYQKINPEWKARWLEALRSGKYQQGKYRLRDNADGADRFCCLGVLCDTYDPNGWGPNNSDPDSVDSRLVYMAPDGGVGSAYLPLQIEAEVGITQSAQDKLTSLNDEPHDFDYIADWIEVYL